MNAATKVWAEFSGSGSRSCVEVASNYIPTSKRVVWCFFVQDFDALRSKRLPCRSGVIRSHQLGSYCTEQRSSFVMRLFFLGFLILRTCVKHRRCRYGESQLKRHAVIKVQMVYEGLDITEEPFMLKKVYLRRKWGVVSLPGACRLSLYMLLS